MLRVENVCASYGGVPVLAGVTVTVDDGELVVLLGPNGHGKSTLLKCICGLMKPTAGAIEYNGTAIHELPSHRIVEMGITYIAEERELFFEMTVLENLRLGGYNRKARVRERENLDFVFQLFPKLKSMEGRLASTLSGGEARMLAIGRGLMSSAQFLAIDEPSLGLAPNLRSDVFSRVRDIHERGRSILLVEQCVPQVFDMADRFYLMEEGRIAFEGDRERAQQDPRVREAFLGSERT